MALGDLSHGTFQISQSLGVGSEAVVDVTVLYQRLEVLDDVTICRLHPSEGEWGLGILVSYATSLQHMRFLTRRAHAIDTQAIRR